MLSRFGIVIAVWLAAIAPRTGLAEELTIPGSGNPEHVLARLADAFNRDQTEHRVIVPPSTGTAGALRDITSGAASLGRVGRPLRDQERGQGIRYYPLARDAVVFVAGAGVTATSITAAQALAVFRGEVLDWRELGGNPGPIRAIGREVSDASRLAIAGHIKEFETITFGENVKLVHLDPQEIELLDRFPTSFSFLNRSALFACKTKVRILALEGVEPTPENLIAGRYPITQEFGLIHRPYGLTAAGQSFLAFLRGPAAMAILHDHGLVPVIEP